MQIGAFASLENASDSSAVDAFVEELAQLRDEGFSRVWVPQFVYWPTC